MRGQDGAVFYEQDAGLYREVQAHRQDYQDTAQFYQQSVDGLMDTLTCNMAHSDITRERFTYNVAAWFIDHQSSYGQQPGFAARLGGLVHAVPIQPDFLMHTDAIGPKLYKNTSIWNQTTRSLGARGLYLLDITFSLVGLRPIEPHESELHLLDQTYFAPADYTSLTGYTVDLSRQSIKRFNKLPAYDECVKQAYDAFIVNNAGPLIDQQTEDEFREAGRRDGADTVGPVDNVPEYFAKTKNRDQQHVRNAIGKLAKSLYGAGSISQHAGLLDQLITPDTKQLAQLALLDHTTYYPETTQQPGRTPLGNRLSWFIGVKDQIVSSLRQSVQKDAAGFGQHIQTELRQLANTAQEAADVYKSLCAPNFLHIPTAEWAVHAR